MMSNSDENLGSSSRNHHRTTDNRSSATNSSSRLTNTRTVVRSLATLLAYSITGVITGVSIVFAFRGGKLPLNATNMHIILCVVGFQFLMAQAIIALAPDSFLTSLNLRQKRLAHWTLQMMGSILALAGCTIKILDKEHHWQTMHGKFGLVAMVFTVASLVNGLTSQYAYELRRFIPGIVSKLTHILFGVVALVSASACLSYGFDMGFFRKWAWTSMANALIIMNSAVTFYIIINPCISFFTKLFRHMRRYRYEEIGE